MFCTNIEKRIEGELEREGRCVLSLCITATFYSSPANGTANYKYKLIPLSA